MQTCANLSVAICLPSSIFREGKDYCEHFSEVYTVLDGRDFVDVFSATMPQLFQLMLEEGDAVSVAAHLVQQVSGSVREVKGPCT